MRTDCSWPATASHRADPRGRWTTYSSHPEVNGRCRSQARRSSPGAVRPSPTPRSRSTAESHRREADIEIAGKSADSLGNGPGNANARAFTWPGQARHSTFSVRRVGVDAEAVEGR